MADRPAVRYSCMECSICYRPYSAVELVPIVLTCGHVLCRECIAQLWMIGFGFVKCPYDGRSTFAIAIDQFRPCYALLDLVREVAEEEAQAARAAAPAVADPPPAPPAVADPPVADRPVVDPPPNAPLANEPPPELPADIMRPNRVEEPEIIVISDDEEEVVLPVVRYPVIVIDDDDEVAPQPPVPPRPAAAGPIRRRPRRRRA